MSIRNTNPYSHTDLSLTVTQAVQQAVQGLRVSDPQVLVERVHRLAGSVTLVLGRDGVGKSRLIRSIDPAGSQPVPHPNGDSRELDPLIEHHATQGSVSHPDVPRGRSDWLPKPLPGATTLLLVVRDEPHTDDAELLTDLQRSLGVSPLASTLIVLMDGVTHEQRLVTALTLQASMHHLAAHVAAVDSHSYAEILRPASAQIVRRMVGRANGMCRARQLKELVAALEHALAVEPRGAALLQHVEELRLSAPAHCLHEVDDLEKTLSRSLSLPPDLLRSLLHLYARPMADPDGSTTPSNDADDPEPSLEEWARWRYAANQLPPRQAAIARTVVRTFEIRRLHRAPISQQQIPDCAERHTS